MFKNKNSRTTLKLNNKDTNYYFGTTYGTIHLFITYSNNLKKILKYAKLKTAFRNKLSLKNVQRNPKSKLQDEERFDINENHCETFDTNILAEPK